MTRRYRHELDGTEDLCARCGEVKSADQFRTLSGRWRSSWCAPCHQSGTREWRSRNRDSINAGRRAAYAPTDHPQRTCLACRSLFTTRVPFQKFCTPACSGRSASRLRNRTHMSMRAARPKVIARWGTRCYLCGDEVTEPSTTCEPRSLSVDHVIPTIAGGSDTIDNLRVVHRACNIAKRERLPSQHELQAAGITP